MENKTLYGDGLTSEFYNISFTFSLSRFKDTGEKSHKIVLPSPPLPYECIYTLILKLKQTWINTSDNPVYTFSFF